MEKEEKDDSEKEDITDLYYKKEETDDSEKDGIINSDDEKKEKDNSEKDETDDSEKEDTTNFDNKKGGAGNLKKKKKDNSKEEDIIDLDDKKEKIIYIIIGAIVVFLIVAFIVSIPKPYETSNLENNTVTRVINGNTFEYYDANLSKIIKIRLLCVSTPTGAKEAGEATDYLRSLIMYKEVTLKSSTTDKDKYGVLLRYVYVNDNGDISFVNKLVVDEGYDNLTIIPPEECNEMK